MRYDELVDRDPLQWWGSGVVTLLGDAAHPCCRIPDSAQAIVDAAIDVHRVLGAGFLEIVASYERRISR